MMIYDSHVHIIDKKYFNHAMRSDNPNFGYTNAKENSAKSFKRIAYKKDIYKALIFPFPFQELLIEDQNNNIIKSAMTDESLYLPIVLLNDDLSFMEKNKGVIKGAKEHFYIHNHDIKSSNISKVYDYLQQCNLPLIIHPHRNSCLPRIKEITNQFKKLKIILAHSGRKRPYTGEGVIEEIIPKFRSINNIYFDTSSIRHLETLRMLVDSVGAQRILFGSDYPYHHAKGEDIYDIERNLFSPDVFDDESIEWIFKKTFESLFRKDIWLRRIASIDEIPFKAFLDRIDVSSRKFLALDKKLKTIHSNLKNKNHIYVLEDGSHIMGYIRESGRPGGGAIIEEVIVDEKYRRKGYGTLMISRLKGMFTYLQAKVVSENENMIKLLEHLNFTLVKKSGRGKISYWSNNGEFK